MADSDKKTVAVTETFTKLFSSITRSSLWDEDDRTRIVWITMLAMADRRGYVGASVTGLAHEARVPVEAVERALAKFLAPDPHSRSPEFEGRRIEVADRGWTLLNYDRFRDMRDEDARREYERERKRAQRRGGSPPVPDVPDCPGHVPDVPLRPAMSAHSEAEAEADLRETSVQPAAAPVAQITSDQPGANGALPLIAASVAVAVEARRSRKRGASVPDGMARAEAAFRAAWSERYGGKEPVWEGPERGIMGKTLHDWPDGLESFVTVAIPAYLADNDKFLVENCHAVRHMRARLDRYRVKVDPVASDRAADALRRQYEDERRREGWS